MLSNKTNLCLNGLIFAGTALVTVAAQSSEPNVADEYMKVYANFDVNKLETFYSKNAKFKDPTSEMWGEYAWNIDGKEHIIKRMKSFFSGFESSSAKYIIREKYASAGHHVYTGKVKFSFTKEGVLETTCMAITTIVSVKGDKVVEHRDYIDYDNLESSKKTGDQNCS
ncbi:MAG: hypothetical protein ACRBHB_14005 [Arenicella sp.]